jgi:hypothetical protein
MDMLPTYTYDDYSGGAAAAYVAFLFVLIPIILVIAAAFYVVSALFIMKIFEKAGVQGKWRAWVPVYNGMVLGKLGDMSPWVVLGAAVASGVLGQIPFIGWIFSLVSLAVVVMYSYRLGIKLNKEWYYLLLWLIPGLGTLIWLGILAYSSDRWNPAVRPAPWANSFLRDTTVWQGIPVQYGAAPQPDYGVPPQQPGYGTPPAPPAQPGYGVPPQPGYGTPPAPPAPPAQPGYGTPPAPPAPPAPPVPPATGPDGQHPQA